MSNFDASDTPAAAGLTAGQMLRAAREAKGLHLAVLSVHLKVSVRQLEALEADEHQRFKGVAFERALAQSVCRQLGIDPVPVLAALPQAATTPAIEPVGLQTRRPAVRTAPRAHGEGKGVSRQVLVLALLMLLGAAALIWWPVPERQATLVSEELQDPAQAAVPMGQASNPLEPSLPSEAAASGLQAEGAASQPAPALPVAAASTLQPSALPAPARAAASAAVPAVAAGLPASQAVSHGLATPGASALSIRLRADAWVEVRDSQGSMVVRRIVKAGEALDLSPSAPVFVYLGKADSAELRWHGQPVELQPHTRNNEARLQLKP